MKKAQTTNRKNLEFCVSVKGKMVIFVIKFMQNYVFFMNDECCFLPTSKSLSFRRNEIVLQYSYHTKGS